MDFVTIVSVIFSFSIWKLGIYEFHLLKFYKQQYLEQKRRLESLRQKIKYIHQANADYSQLFRENHDMKNHLLALSFLMEQKDYPKAIEYIQQLKKEKKQLSS